MTAKQLLNPRFEIIADYPDNHKEVGSILECPDYANDFTKKYWVQANEKYPHLFRKMNWWEKRNKEDMPKRVICKAIPNDADVLEIEEWDMELGVGWLDKDERSCCNLHAFNPEYGYFPVD